MQVAEVWRSDRFDTRLRQGRLEPQHVRAVARLLADQHAAAPVGGEIGNAPERLGRQVHALSAQLRDAVPDPVPIDAIEAWQLHFVRTEAERLLDRARRGRVRRCHGTIALEAAYADSQGAALLGSPREGGPRIADVAADVARLSAALAAAGRCDLAERFVAAYVEAGQDFELYRVLPLYESLARADLAAAALGAGQVEAACRMLRPVVPVLRPRVVAVGGWIASGKSTVAARLADEAAVPVVSAERVRHALAASHDGGRDEVLSPGFAYAVCREVVARAEFLLDSGRPAILDGCFHSRATRNAARNLARDRGLPFVFVECRADEETIRRRLAARPAAGRSAGSWRATLDRSAAEWEPVTDLPSGEHRIIDTSHGAPRGLERVRRARPASPSLVA